jgi:hypothetical protein
MNAGRLGENILRVLLGQASGCILVTSQRRPETLCGVNTHQSWRSQQVYDDEPAERRARHPFRGHGERRRDGLRCLIIELRKTEIDALVRNGFLKDDTRNDSYAIEVALYQFLERTLA